MELSTRNMRMLSHLGQRGAVCVTALEEIAEECDNLFVLTADMAQLSALERFEKKNNDKFVNTGISEQNMIGVASGLAYEGNNWSATETNLLTLPDNMKYVVGESNELAYAVGSRSVGVDSSNAYFFVAGVDGGRVGSNDYGGFCYSDSGSASNGGFSNSVPVRPIVSLESSVQLTKVTE